MPGPPAPAPGPTYGSARSSPSRSSPPSFPLDGRLEGAERLVPQPLHVPAHDLQSPRVDPVQRARAITLPSDQARVPQHRQVLGDRRTAHRKVTGEFTDGSRTLPEQLEHRPAGGVTQRLDHSPRLSVSVHLP